MGADQIVVLLECLIGLLVVVVVILVVMYFLTGNKKEKKGNEEEFFVEEKTEDKTETTEEYGKFQGVLTKDSIYNFMEFDEIVDDMIIRKNRTQYVMVIQCNGINYDLMSQSEKYAVEEGFVQFLNTLRFPVQLYIQSRTLNLRNVLATYEAKIDVLEDDLEKAENKLKQARQTKNQKTIDKLEFDRRRKSSVLDYARDITDYVSRLNSNQNILQQKTYVVISYYTAELGGSTEIYGKEELNNLCFSELYTRAQNVISSLGNSQVTGRILDSEELAELLFTAYNRDDQELIQINKMLDAEYDSLYSTGKDVLEKKQEKLEQEINIAAIDLTTDSIIKADKKKQEEDKANEESKNKKIREEALNILSSYQEQLDPKIYDLAEKEITTAIPEEKGEKKDDKDKERKTVTGFSARRVLKSKTSETDKKEVHQDA